MNAKGGKTPTERCQELEEAIAKIKEATFEPGQTLPQLHRTIAIILQDLKK
jgi:predicted RNase H-like HicB family nuclease